MESVTQAEAGVHLAVDLIEGKPNWITRRVLRLALQAIRYANVRFGILPAQSGLRRNDEQNQNFPEVSAVG